MALRKMFAGVPAAEAKAAAIALAVGIVLTSVKFLGYFVTGSAAIFTDAMESIVNLAGGAFALYSLTVAHRPADSSHPYGHGKIEFLSAGFEGGMILVAGIVALVKGVDSLISHGADLQLQSLTFGLLLMAAAFAVNGGLGLYLIRVGTKQGSIALEADGRHLLSDAWTSLATIVALLLVRFMGWHWADPVFAIGIALYISIVGITLLRRAEAGLTDRQDEDDAKLLNSILSAHLPGGGQSPTICSFHKVRHRHAGRVHWVEFHLVVPADWNVLRGHEVASAIEEEIEAAVGEGNATAHVEPCISGICPQCPATAISPVAS